METSESAPLVSIVVPVYNVEAYLSECVDSILQQSYQNIEVILVDDGSPDECPAICDRYANADHRVISLHKNNGGLSDARNYGLAHSHGSWISFIDSDDYVSRVWIEALLAVANSAHCKLAGIRFEGVFKDGDSFSTVNSTPDVCQYQILTDHDAVRAIMYQAMACGVQGFLYHRSLLPPDPFPRGLYYEDLASTYRIIRDAQKVALIDCPALYAYRTRDNSIIRQSYRHVKAESAITISAQIEEDINEWYPDLTNAASSRCFSVCRMVFGQVPAGADATDEEKADRQALWEVVKRHRSVVLHDNNARPRERLAAAIASTGEGPFAAFCSLARRTGKMQ